MAREERSFSGRLSYEEMKERANQRGGGFDTYVKSAYKMYKVKDGKNLVRILPPSWDKAKHYGYDIWVNYNIGPDNQSYLSLSKMKNEADPIAEARREADRADDEELARQLQPRQRVLMWVIDRDNEDEGPLLWAAPFTLDKDVLNISIDDDTKEVTEIDDKDEGCDLRFYKEGTGIGTKYPASKMKLMEPGPLSDDAKQQKAWLGYVKENPVPECLQFYSYDHIAQVFNGHAKKRDEDDDEQPTKRARKPEPDEDDEAPRKSRRAEPDEDEKPWDDDEKPARKARARLEADDDDEPPPRKAKKSDDDDEEGGSIRDRLRARRNKAQETDDED